MKEKYLINTTDKWIHIMKRAIKPGGKVSLSELYKEYNKEEVASRVKDMEGAEIEGT